MLVSDAFVSQSRKPSTWKMKKLFMVWGRKPSERGDGRRSVDDGHRAAGGREFEVLQATFGIPTP